MNAADTGRRNGRLDRKGGWCIIGTVLVNTCETLASHTIEYHVSIPLLRWRFAVYQNSVGPH